MSRRISSIYLLLYELRKNKKVTARNANINLIYLQVLKSSLQIISKLAAEKFQSKSFNQILRHRGHGSQLGKVAELDFK